MNGDQATSGCADLAVRRRAITSRVPREAPEDYESALRRVLFNPDWSERP